MKTFDQLVNWKWNREFWIAWFFSSVLSIVPPALLVATFGQFKNELLSWFTYVFYGGVCGICLLVAKGTKKPLLVLAISSILMTFPSLFGFFKRIEKYGIEVMMGALPNWGASFLLNLLFIPVGFLLFELVFARAGAITLGEQV
ncbi:MAG: hypothetical protein ACKVQS_00910 [Fimbriimonadaceae bacterium]